LIRSQIRQGPRTLGMALVKPVERVPTTLLVAPASAALQIRAAPVAAAVVSVQAAAAVRAAAAVQAVTVVQAAAAVQVAAAVQAAAAVQGDHNEGFASHKHFADRWLCFRSAARPAE